MKYINGGVTAAKGFTASGIHCGIRKNQTKKDLAMIKSENKCSAAAVYTQNKVYGAPITVTRANLADGMAQAVIVNSGNANTCNSDGVQKAEQMCGIAAEALGVDKSDVIVASTGVIGLSLDVTPIAASAPALAGQMNGQGGHDAAEAIMTTDTVAKECAVSFDLGGKTVTLGACCKGSGMIHPNMATMLCFMTTDCRISSAMLQKALSDVVKDTFNMISVDGDTSTNDMVCIMANGQAENPVIEEENEDFALFRSALAEVSVKLSRLIAGDGEGAQRLLECTVSGAPTVETAKNIAKSIICSSLVKTAMFGADANWGRILCAIGYTPGDFAVDCIDVSLSSCKGEVKVCQAGFGIDFSEEKAKEILLEDEIRLTVEMNQGTAAATAWGCDLTYDYVKINGDYRT
ncbi:MAG: bifunctional glutamate N-acetyltransferase/amino-acid acetyltransferase ArgJ [Oscillospiraceae bacterium]|nr:bifunctional glutamate N-acetyltransferase/amino-acid acetyltransferase ArgJ [Oscillospiraceae bacterium]